MRKLLAVVAMCAAGAAHAQVTTLDANSWSVTFDPTLAEPGFEVHVDADALEWSVPGHALATAEWYPVPGIETGGFVFGAFDFQPLTGYSITGYDITYNLSFRTLTYQVREGDFLDYGPVGTLLYNQGGFTASTGASFTFSGQPAQQSVTLTDHIAGPLFPLGFIAQAHATGWGDICIRFAEIMCDTYLRIYASTSIDSITIQPHVVAVPEPGTYALMLCGLLAVWGARRHCSKAP